MNPASATPATPSPEQGTPPSSGYDWNSPAGRRRFLANTGKAGALTILGMHGLKVEVLAGQTSGSADS